MFYSTRNASTILSVVVLPELLVETSVDDEDDGGGGDGDDCESVERDVTETLSTDV